MTNMYLGALAAVAVLCPTHVSADAWDVFVRNCLDPIRAGELAPPDGLEVHEAFKNDGDTYATYRVDDNRATLAVSDGRGGQPFWCRLSADDEGGDAELANRFLAWSSQPQELENFRQVDSDGPVLKLQSVDGHSPALQISMNLKAQNTGVVFMAKELD